MARGRICNVSISGAFIVAPIPVRIFSYVKVRFVAMIHGKRESTSVEAQVVRKGAAGFAVEWCELAPEAVRALFGIVEGGQSREMHGVFASHERPGHERPVVDGGERSNSKARDILIHRRGSRFQ